MTERDAIIELAIAVKRLAQSAALQDAASRAQDVLAAMAAQSESKPVPMSLECPQCKRQHIDRGSWATRPHKTHLCEYCDAEWRPHEFATVGVAQMAQSESKAEMPLTEAETCPHAFTRLVDGKEYCVRCLTLLHDACGTCEGLRLVETTGPAGVPHVVLCPDCSPKPCGTCGGGGRIDGVIGWRVCPDCKPADKEHSK